MNNTRKQCLIAFISGALTLYAIFIKTMLVHSNNQIIWEAIALITPTILAISLVSVPLVVVLKIEKWFLSILIAVIAVIIGATIYVQFTFKI